MKKKKLSRVLAVLLGVLMLAVCIPAAAFAEEAATDSGKITVNLHVWTPKADILNHEMGITFELFDLHGSPYSDKEKSAVVYESFEIQSGESFTLPTKINGCEVYAWGHGSPTLSVPLWQRYVPGETLAKENLQNIHDGVADFYALAPEMYSEEVKKAYEEIRDLFPTGKDVEPTPTENPVEDGKMPDATPAPTAKPAETPAAEQPAAVTYVPQLQSQSSEPAAPVDTRTEQQKEIDEAIANGTWGNEYTTCQQCGYHNWTRQGNVYVCDTCGNTTTEVVSAKGVKGYVGSGAIAAVAPGKTADNTPKYATAKEAQAAADKREADYAAAVAAFQKQIAEQNAAYLASLK